MGKFAMKWARKTDVPLYYEMIDPVLTVDDGCFPSLEFAIDVKCGDCAPTISNKNVYLVINGIEVNYLKLVSVDYSNSFNVDGLCRIRYKAAINTCDPLHIDYLVEEFKECSKITFTPPVENGKTMAQHIANAQNIADDMLGKSDLEKWLDDVLEKFDPDQWKVKEEEMNKSYEVKANANTACKFKYSDPFLEDVVKERREKHLKETLDNILKESDSHIRKNPYVILDYLEVKEDDSTQWARYNVSIERVKIDDPWVIMFWSDGGVTKAKCDELDSFDPEVGIMVCICKKLFRTPQNLRKILKNLTKDYYKELKEETSDFTFDEIKKSLSKLKEDLNGINNK